MLHIAFATIIACFPFVTALLKLASKVRWLNQSFSATAVVTAIGTIEKALNHHAAVETVSVSLTQEKALVEYDPGEVRPQALLETLRQMGYNISDPRKLNPYEDDERDLIPILLNRKATI